MVLRNGRSVSAIKNHKAWILAKDFERFPALLSSVSSTSRGASFPKSLLSGTKHLHRPRPAG